MTITESRADPSYTLQRMRARESDLAMEREQTDARVLFEAVALAAASAVVATHFM